MRTGHTVVLSPGPVLIDGFRQGASKPGKERRKGRQGVTRVPELSRLAEADLREIRHGGADEVLAGRASYVECFGGREPPETVTLQVPRGREPREPLNEG